MSTARRVRSSARQVRARSAERATDAREGTTRPATPKGTERERPGHHAGLELVVDDGDLDLAPAIGSADAIR
jgi:hypothetical protein